MSKAIVSLRVGISRRWQERKDGKNMLGKLWMEIRAEIRTETGK